MSDSYPLYPRLPVHGLLRNRDGSVDGVTVFVRALDRVPASLAAFEDGRHYCRVMPRRVSVGPLRPGQAGPVAAAMERAERALSEGTGAGDGFRFLVAVGALNPAGAPAVAERMQRLRTGPA